MYVGAKVGSALQFIINILKSILHLTGTQCNEASGHHIYEQPSDPVGGFGSKL